MFIVRWPKEVQDKTVADTDGCNCLCVQFQVTLCCATLNFRSFTSWQQIRNILRNFSDWILLHGRCCITAKAVDFKFIYFYWRSDWYNIWDLTSHISDFFLWIFLGGIQRQRIFKSESYQVSLRNGVKIRGGSKPLQYTLFSAYMWFTSTWTFEN